MRGHRERPSSSCTCLLRPLGTIKGPITRRKDVLYDYRWCRNGGQTWGLSTWQIGPYNDGGFREFSCQGRDDHGGEGSMPPDWWRVWVSCMESLLRNAWHYPWNHSTIFICAEWVSWTRDPYNYGGRPNLTSWLWARTLLLGRSFGLLYRYT